MAEKLNIYELDKFNPNDFFIPLNFSVADFRDISSRNGYYSKTIEIPSTKKNDSLLGQSFDITAEGFFDRNKKQKAFIERDGITYLDGFMQLKAVELKNGKPYLYKIVLYSNLSEWTGLINGSIRGLSYSSVELNATNVEASWSNNGLNDEYVFPLINYGNLVVVNSATSVDVTDLLPAVFVYNILQKTFKEIGYQLKPGIFKQKEFANLIIPTVDSDITSSRAFLDTQGGGIYSLGDNPSQGTYNQIITSSLADETVNFELYNDSNSQNNFSTSINRFTAPFDCLISSTVSLKIYNGQYFSDNTVTVKIKHYNSLNVLQDTPAIEILDIPKGNVSRTFNLSLDSYELSSGDYLIITVQSANSNTLLAVNQRSFNVYIESTDTIQVGDTIGVGDYLPDIKKIDFIKCIIQMFNLYHITDEKQKTVEFLTRDEFYKNISDSDDWTEKVDYSKSIEIEQIDEKLSKELQFKYIKDENDALLTEFYDRYGVTLGDYSETLDNEFLKGEKVVANIPFAPTYASGTIDQTDGETIPLPWIPNNYGTLNDKVSVEPRILVYDGLIDKDWTFNLSAKTQLPFSHFVKKDSVFSDLSLSFRSFRLYNNSIRNADVGLVEKFYNNQIKMLNNSRLNTMYLKLSPVDILNLDFRKPKYINGKYYYLNKIEDYKTGTEETVKCELINIP